MSSDATLSLSIAFESSEASASLSTARAFVFAFAINAKFVWRFCRRLRQCLTSLAWGSRNLQYSTVHIAGLCHLQCSSDDASRSRLIKKTLRATSLATIVACFCWPKMFSVPERYYTRLAPWQSLKCTSKLGLTSSDLFPGRGRLYAACSYSKLSLRRMQWNIHRDASCASTARLSVAVSLCGATLLQSDHLISPTDAESITSMTGSTVGCKAFARAEALFGSVSRFPSILQPSTAGVIDKVRSTSSRRNVH